MKIKKSRRLGSYGMSFVLAVLMSVCARAQCPASITASAVVSTASCPSSGTVTISSNVPGGTPLIYTLLSGPVGTPVNAPQNSNVFSGLSAGAYTLKVECTNGTSTTIGFTIANGYTPISGISTSAASACGTFAQGGKITVNGVSGGTLPLQYSVVKNSSANYPDSQSVYTTDTFKTVTSYGVYQVRVKDGCNQFYTQTVNVQPELPGIQIGHWQVLNNQPCATNSIDVFWNAYDPVSGTYRNVSDYISAGGIRVTMYEKAAGSCAPTGAPVVSNMLVTQDNFVVPNVPSHQYYIQTISPCGDTVTSCDDYTPAVTPDMWVYTTPAGCPGSVSNPPSQSIREVSEAFLNYPVTVSVKNSSNAVVYTQTLNTTSDIFSVSGLPLGNYVVTIIDKCGAVLTRNSWDPSTGPVPSLALDHDGLGECVGSYSETQTGTKEITMRIDGYLPDLANASLSILSGPSNVGIAGFNSPAGSNLYRWANVLPGNYVIRATTSCGTTDFPYTVDTSGLLVQSVTATAATNCSGGGTVTATSNYNGTYALSYILSDAGTGQSLDSNATGQFSNLGAGNYIVKMKLLNYCSGIPYYTPSNTVTIAAQGAGPQITRKIGIICEDSSGNTTGTGSVYLTLAGGSPLLLEYKQSTASTWTTFSTNAPSNVAIDGLVPYNIYDVRVTSCGITSATQVSIGVIQSLSVTTQNNPCSGVPYSLDAPQIAGATYQWRNPSNIVVSNTYDYSIASYNSSYDGPYTCTLIWGSCLSRNITVKLNSQKCGTPLPIKLMSFATRVQACAVELYWQVSNAATFSRLELQRSNDGKYFSTIAFISWQAAVNSYSYTDLSPLEGNGYYRLKMVDVDGMQNFSGIEQATVHCDKGGYVSIYPVPASNKVTVTLSGADITTALHVTDMAGKTIPVPVNTQGNSSYSIDVSGLSNGSYLLEVKNAHMVKTEKITIYK